MFWFWSSAGDANKKKCGLQNIARHYLHLVNHRQSTDLTITETCSYSNFNLQDKILLCLAWFTMIPRTFLELFPRSFLKLHLIFN